MEENQEDDIIYDLESPAHHAEPAEEQRAQESHAGSGGEVGAQENAESSEGSDSPDCSELSDSSDSSDPSEISDCADGAAVRMTAPHEDELRRMVEEMGAERLLEIIRDNRNAAIRQIISEVEAAREVDMPSGSGSSFSCGSIFDLAALA